MVGNSAPLKPLCGTSGRPPWPVNGPCRIRSEASGYVEKAFGALTMQSTIRRRRPILGGHTTLYVNCPSHFLRQRGLLRTRSGLRRGRLGPRAPSRHQSPASFSAKYHPTEPQRRQQTLAWAGETPRRSGREMVLSRHASDGRDAGLEIGRMFRGQWGGKTPSCDSKP